ADENTRPITYPANSTERCIVRNRIASSVPKAGPRGLLRQDTGPGLAYASSIMMLSITMAAGIAGLSHPHGCPKSAGSSHLAASTNDRYQAKASITLI